MKSSLRPFLNFLYKFIVVAMFVLSPELIGGDIAEKLKGLLGERYLIIMIGLGTLALLLSEKDKLFPKKKNKKQDNGLSVSETELQQIRKGLSESHQGRIQSKLAGRLPINLELKYSTEGTTTKDVIYDKDNINSKKIKEELVTLFDKHKGRLLIIGDPGAGKTTLLLQLASQLIERKDNQIPIILDMATWQSRFSSVEEWLMELLPQIGFSKTITKQLVIEKQLLPLFDGLDELEKENRQGCLEAIGKYGISQNIRYVISSRISEYAETVDAPVYCQIKVKPLTITQIENSLKEIKSPETNGMLNAMDRDSSLVEAIQTPFYLNTTQLLFASMKSWEELGFKSTSLDGRKAEIVEKFINESTTAFKTHTSIQVKKYLGFLAYTMNKKQIVNFELVDLQYDWILFSIVKLIQIILIKGLLFYLSYWLFWGILFGFYSGLKFLVMFIGIQQFYGLLISLKNHSTYPNITTRDRILLSFKNFIPDKDDKVVYYIFMIGGLFISLLLSLFISLQEGLSQGFKALFIGLPISQGLVLLLFILNGIDKSIYPFLKIKNPYQRFKSSMWILHFSILQHMYLKWLLHRKGLLPFKLVKFLQKATVNNILESDGGSWRFRHRVLQNYFSEHWKKNYGG